MRNREELLETISELEKVIYGSKLKRLAHNPLRYLYGIFFREVIYRFSSKPMKTKARLFTGQEVEIALPSAMDLYILGLKTHPSELNLVKFIIKNLSVGNHFLDIGAHYGFFSLLASNLVENDGKVFSFEPSTHTFSLLNNNVSSSSQISVFNQCISDKKESITFYEFPTLFSEYNSMEKSQYIKENWYRNNTPIETVKSATSIDDITSSQFMPNMIKIDVEGAEHKVIMGGVNYFKQNRPIIIIEFILDKSHLYRDAISELLKLSYKMNIISRTGDTEQKSWDELQQYMINKTIDSENLVFLKCS